MTDIFLASLILGAATGLLAGLFGIGGGIIIVPVLMWLFERLNLADKHIMIMAIATSLATIIPTAIASSYAHHQRQNLLWPVVRKLVPGIIIGSLLMSFVAAHLPAHLLRYFFIAYLIYVATNMLLQKKTVISVQSRWKGMDYVAGAIIGGLSTLLGIGGGTLTVPYLLGKNLVMKNAVAVSSACGLPIAMAGTIGYILTGWKLTSLPEYSLGFIYLPAFLGITASSIFTASIGARLANSLPAKHLKHYFALLLYIIAAKMLW
ncbi:sulfite exporter TauE/SafE family protein [methane-oxidizing endosymbiont of Gigantopelta aegis]|uniref:sulfite exporter TauE/SafE family protein n=1 Tax=methane-oxidizing endosymbiont of Gigantopelta aegis TaxID=2794938 RepID=UPI0018DBE22F|nr:sulfite exporter TauE/SafE family protein [methane-oxidizing endosymbiont of Gigantopelta aegis]